MNVYIRCEKCNDELEVVQEWTDRDGLNATVYPCDSCLEEAREDERGLVEWENS